MDKIEAELQAAAIDVVTPLRQGRGVDEAAADRLKTALRAAEKAWASSATITKSSANLFVDLASGIDACSYAYAGETADRVRKLADEVADLVRACVA